MAVIPALRVRARGRGKEHRASSFVSSVDGRIISRGSRGSSHLPLFGNDSTPLHSTPFHSTRFDTIRFDSIRFDSIVSTLAKIRLFRLDIVN